MQMGLGLDSRFIAIFIARMLFLMLAIRSPPHGLPDIDNGKSRAS
jgi:hypothetical protein